MQALKPDDWSIRYSSVNILEKIDNDNSILSSICFSDEATFHLSGKDKKKHHKNSHIWISVGTSACYARTWNRQPKGEYLVWANGNKITDAFSSPKTYCQPVPGHRRRISEPLAGTFSAKCIRVLSAKWFFSTMEKVSLRVPWKSSQTLDREAAMGIHQRHYVDNNCTWKEWSIS